MLHITLAKIKWFLTRQILKLYSATLNKIGKVALKLNYLWFHLQVTSDIGYDARL